MDVSKVRNNGVDNGGIGTEHHVVVTQEDAAGNSASRISQLRDHIPSHRLGTSSPLAIDAAHHADDGRMKLSSADNVGRIDSVRSYNI